jgi:hypothetical protein
MLDWNEMTQGNQIQVDKSTLIVDLSKESFNELMERYIGCMIEKIFTHKEDPTLEKRVIFNPQTEYIFEGYYKRA